MFAGARARRIPKRAAKLGPAARSQVSQHMFGPHKHARPEAGRASPAANIG